MPKELPRIFDQQKNANSHASDKSSRLPRTQPNKNKHNCLFLLPAAILCCIPFSFRYYLPSTVPGKTSNKLLYCIFSNLKRLGQSTDDILPLNLDVHSLPTANTADISVGSSAEFIRRHEIRDRTKDGDKTCRWMPV